MSLHKLRVSVVIPVYNEAGYLEACLEAIKQQISKPYEVFVVDNNSTDDFKKITDRYSFVELLKERQQGVAYARTRGFNKARGDIIARIDADTILPANWIAQIQTIFTDQTIAAVTGQPDYYDFPLRRIANAIDTACRRWLSRKMVGSHYLYGSDMALRRTAWQDIRGELCAPQAGMHEDFDVGIHLQQAGYNVIYCESLKAGICSRRIDTPFISYARYTLVSPYTYKMHKLAAGRHMYRIVFVCWVCYLPGRLLYRSFDHTTSTYSLFRLFSVTETRIDPTVHVA